MAAKSKRLAGGRKAQLTSATKKLATVLDDAWEETDAAGWNAAEALLECGLGDAWEALAHGEWVAMEGEIGPEPVGEGEAEARAAAAWMAENVVRTRTLVVPAALQASQSPAMRDLVDHLGELIACVSKGEEPPTLLAATRGEDPVAAELAAGWLAMYRDHKGDAEAAEEAQSANDGRGATTRRRRAKIVQIEGGKANLAPREPSTEDLASLGGLGGEDLSGLEELGDLGDLGDLDEDDEFAALERELKSEGEDLEATLAALLGGAGGAKPGTKAPPSRGVSTGGRAGGGGGGLAALGAALAGIAGDGGDDGSEEEEDIELTPFNRKLMAALEITIDAMEADEVLEIESARKEPLVRELVRAASNARSTKHMLTSLTRALVDSEQVEEIYATDDQIRRRLQADLGG